MLVIKIELHSANTGKVTEIGRANIINNGTGTSKRGNYDVEIMRRGTTDKVQRRGSVTDYPRLSYTVWELVRRALVAGLGKWPVHPGEPEEFDQDVKDGYARSLKEAQKIAKGMEFPVVLKPSFALAPESDGIIVDNFEEFNEKVILALDQSPTYEILVEESPFHVHSTSVATTTEVFESVPGGRHQPVLDIPHGEMYKAIEARLAGYIKP